MKNWEMIFGIPDPALVAHTVATPQDLQRIVRAAFVSDTDLAFQPCELVVLLEKDQIRQAAVCLKAEGLSPSALLLLVGVNKRKALRDVLQAVEGMDPRSPSAEEYDRYKALMSDEHALNSWVIGAAARCATRLALAAKALGHTAMVQDVFDAKQLRQQVSAPEEIDIPFVVAVGGTLPQRLGQGVAGMIGCHANAWGLELTLPSEDVPEELHYSDSLVSYFDILGFRNAVEDWTPARIESVLVQLLSLSSHDPRLRRVTRRGLSTFSDHIVRTVALDELNEQEVAGAIEFELSQIQLIQANLAITGTFLRGGVTRGPIYIDENVVFGPALVEAYELEYKVAKYPRVVVHGKLHALLRPEQHLWFEADDHILSLNYLAAGDDLRERIRLLQLHAGVVRNALAEISQAEAIEKLRWLAAFHNSVVAQIPDADLTETGASRRDLVISSQAI